MRWYPDRIPDWISRFFPDFTWHGERSKNKVFLTFDDGPTPVVTEFILDELAKYDFKATFFCIGDNVSKHPELFQRIKDEGHTVGNHTQNHLNGWKTDDDEYLENIAPACQGTTGRFAKAKIKSHLFRPPYGRIKRSQARKLREQGFQIVMWDVLSGDFDLNRSADSILKNLKKNTRSGSIIVFHDSKKAEPILREILPKYLDWIKANDLRGKSLSVYER
jgi:peptidoglycan/xylan/chitin deacetylase (PgdA/CDA1 family)